MAIEKQRRNAAAAGGNVRAAGGCTWSARAAKRALGGRLFPARRPPRRLSTQCRRPRRRSKSGLFPLRPKARNSPARRSPSAATRQQSISRCSRDLQGLLGCSPSSQPRLPAGQSRRGGDAGCGRGGSRGTRPRLAGRHAIESLREDRFDCGLGKRILRRSELRRLAGQRCDQPCCFAFAQNGNQFGHGGAGDNSRAAAHEFIERGRRWPIPRPRPLRHSKSRSRLPTQRPSPSPRRSCARGRTRAARRIRSAARRPGRAAAIPIPQRAACWPSTTCPPRQCSSIGSRGRCWRELRRIATRKNRPASALVGSTAARGAWAAINATAQDGAFAEWQARAAAAAGFGAASSPSAAGIDEGGGIELAAACPAAIASNDSAAAPLDAAATPLRLEPIRFDSAMGMFDDVEVAVGGAPSSAGAPDVTAAGLKKGHWSAAVTQVAQGTPRRRKPRRLPAARRIKAWRIWRKPGRPC